MRVLINAISAKAGGIVTYTSNLIAALEQRGIDFLVAVPDTFPDSPSVLKVAATNYGPLRRLLWEQTVWRHLIKKHKADVLFSSANFALLNSPVPQLLLIREGGLFDPLYLSTIAPCQGLNAALQRYLRRRLMLLSARHNDHIMTPTQAMRSMFLNWAPDLADRCSVNSYGTLLDTFHIEERRPWRQDGTLKLLYVSVYYPHKNPSDGVLACEILTSQGLPATMRLTMDLTQITKVRGSARDIFHLDRGVGQGLVSLGTVRYTDLPTIYAQHDVFIFPSISETFGHPMTEAMASGIPVVAVDVAVNREILGDAALYYDPFQPTQLAERLRELDENPRLRQELVKKGLERVASQFDWNDHVDRLVEVLRKLTRQR